MSQVLRNVDMVVWVPSLLQLLLVSSKVYVTTAILTKENMDYQRKRKDKLKQCQCVGEERKLIGLWNENQLKHRDRILAWEENNVSRWERKGCCQICQLQTWHIGQSCHSAVFWAAQELWIYSKLRGVGGRTDKRRRGGIYSESLSVLWLSDRTVKCVRWLHIQVI